MKKFKTGNATVEIEQDLGEMFLGFLKFVAPNAERIMDICRAPEPIKMGRLNSSGEPQRNLGRCSGVGRVFWLVVFWKSI